MVGNSVETVKEQLPLLTPYKLDSFDLKHRMVYAPLTRSRALGKIPQPAAELYYSQRASDGGFVLTEATCICEEGHGYLNTPGIYTKDQMEAWKPIVKAVKQKGAIFFLPTAASYQPNGAHPVAPSPIPIRDARNALAVGFGVEIHGATGYIVDQFLKESSNKRTDEYGGSIENRTRFCREVVDAVVSEVGSQRVGIRLSPYSGYLYMHDSDPVALNLRSIEHLNSVNLLYAHFIEAYVAGYVDIEASAETLTPFRQAFIAAGGYKRDSGNEAIKTGHANLITYGRLFLANPDLPKRFELNAPLNKYDRDLFYSPEKVKGYTDYPFLEE